MMRKLLTSPCRFLRPSLPQSCQKSNWNTKVESRTWSKTQDPWTNFWAQLPLRKIVFSKLALQQAKKLGTQTQRVNQILQPPLLKITCSVKNWAKTTSTTWTQTGNSSSTWPCIWHRKPRKRKSLTIPMTPTVCFMPDSKQPKSPLKWKLMLPRRIRGRRWPIKLLKTLRRSQIRRNQMSSNLIVTQV